MILFSQIDLKIIKWCVHAVFVSTRRAILTVERDVSCHNGNDTITAKGEIPTMDHLSDIFHFSLPGMVKYILFCPVYKIKDYYEID